MANRTACSSMRLPACAVPPYSRAATNLRAPTTRVPARPRRKSANQSDASSTDSQAGFHYAYACDGGSLDSATYDNSITLNGER